MSIDTALKRFSAVNVGCPWRGINAYPDGGGQLGDEAGNFIGDESGNLIGDNTVSSVNRLALLDLYSGFFLGNAFTLTAISGSFSWVGYNATFSPTTHINTSQQRFAAMNIGNVWRGLNLFPTGTITKSGRSVLSNFYSVPVTTNAYTITCQSGSYIWDGEPSFSDFELTNAASGVFSYTGNPATLLATRKITLTSGVFAYTGSDSNLQKLTQKTLFPATGFFVFAGSDAVFDRPRGLTAETGSFSSEGYQIHLIYTDSKGFIYEGGPRRKFDAGGRRRHRYEIEIDGEVFDAKSEDQAIYFLEKLKEEAHATAKLALERATRAQRRPVRKVLQDARKALVVPEIQAPGLTEPAHVILSEIEDLYKDTLMTIEIAALMRKQDEDEEDILLMLL